MVTNMIACCVFLRSNLCWDTRLLVLKILDQIGVFSLSFQGQETWRLFHFKFYHKSCGLFNFINKLEDEKSKRTNIVDMCINVLAWSFEDIAIHIYATIFNLGFLVQVFRTNFQHTIFSNFGLQYVHNISTYPINQNNLVLWVIGIKDVGFWYWKIYILIIWRFLFGLWKYNLNNGDFFLGKGEWIGLLGFNFSSDHNYKLHLIFISQPKHIASQWKNEL
jgi:hypothetical protein